MKRALLALVTAKRIGHATSSSAHARWMRLWGGALLLIVSSGVATTGYKAIGPPEWTWLDCFYMAAITLSTVGFGETLPGMEDQPLARAWTLLVILLGSGALLYFVSMLTAIVVEGDLQGMIRGRRMSMRIDAIENHVIVCGAGGAGLTVVRELVATNMPFVLVHDDEELLERLHDQDPKMLLVPGHPSDEEALRAAGIERASGAVVSVTDDRDAVFVTVTVHSMNQNLRIIASAVDPRTAEKLKRAGAHGVVSPFFIGGMRMVSEMIRPNVVHFLDRMLRDTDKNLRIEELPVPRTSALVGATLARADLLGREGVLVLAVRGRDGEYLYNPKSETEIQAEDKLIVMVHAPSVGPLRQKIADGSFGPLPR